MGGDRVTYSTMERSIIEVLRKAEGKRVTTNELVEAVYPTDARPLSARQSVLSVVKSLIAKTEARRDTFTVRRSDRSGPRSIEFWLEAVKR